jgi:RNA polymerase subunit RPABC4/transcription elongation factor Spt4
MTCQTCQTQTSQNFCPNCGQAATLKRIDGHYIIHEIEHVIHFEKGILYTVKELLIRPGLTVREFINKNRNRLVKPIIFIVITSLIYSLINTFFHIEEGYMKIDEATPSTFGAMMKWIQSHYGYGNILMGVFIAWWLKLFFRKYDFNFYEIIIMLCFTIGMGMLIFAVFALIQGLFHIMVMQFAGILGVVYMTWAIGQFFDKTKKMNYLKAFFAYVLGSLSFFAVLAILGTMIDLIK